MTSMNIALRIRAVVEGLKGIDAVSASVRKIGSDGRGATRRLNEAFRALDMRPFRVIDREIKATQAAYKRLAASGKLSASQLKVAHRQMRDQVRALRNELQGKKGGLGNLMGGILPSAPTAMLAAAGAAVTAFAKRSLDAARQTNAAFRGLEAVANYTGVGIRRAFQEAAKISADGLMKIGDSSKALQNLLARGYNMEQAVEVINRLKDAAAFNRSAHLSMSEAVVSATEGLKNENSTLVDNAGVTKNVSVMWKDYARQVGKTVDELTQQEKIQAEVNGILRETAAQTGNAARASEGLEGAYARFSKTASEVMTAFGSALEPAVTWVTNLGTGILNHVVKPILALPEMIGVAAGFIVQTFNDIIHGNWSAIERNKKLAGESIDEIIARYDKGLTPAAQRATDNINAQVQAERKALQAADERARAAEEAAKLSDKRLALAKAITESEARIEKDSIDRRQRELDQQLEDGLIKYADYYAERQRLAEQALAIEIASAEAELKARRDSLSVTTDEGKRLQTLAAIKELETDLVILARKRGDIARQGDRDALNARFKDLGIEIERAAKTAEQALEGGLAGALDSVMKNVDGVGGAFRQMGNVVVAEIRRIIAQMLASQMMSSMGFTKLFSANVRHHGGMGSASGATRRVSPDLFIGAPRLHAGYVPGLAPGEIPTIIRSDEEVITPTDPRHAWNRGRYADAGPLRVEVHPDALRMTLRDWLEGELARAHATR